MPYGRFAWFAFWISVAFGTMGALATYEPLYLRLFMLAGIALYVAMILAIFSDEMRR
jgi:hypothetical protein